MSVRFVRGSRGILAAVSSVLGLIVPAAAAQADATLQANSQISGAVPSQAKDSGVIPATGANQAAVTDMFSGPVQIGTLAIGSADVSVSAAASEGLITFSTRNSNTATVATLAVLTNTEAKASDSIQITSLPGGQGQLAVMYFPTTLANGANITGSGGTWSGTLRLTANVQDFASDGTPGAGYALAADYGNSNLGPTSHDTGPVTVPVLAGDKLTFDIDQTLQTSAAAPRGGSSSVSADVTTRFFVVPLSPGLAFTSASGHSYLPLAGDIDVNGKVDFSDLLALAQHYGATGAAWPQGDFNADGSVDFGDLLALAQNYGQSLSPSALTALPDPSVAAPAAVAAAGLLAHRRRA